MNKQVVRVIKDNTGRIKLIEYADGTFELCNIDFDYLVEEE